MYAADSAGTEATRSLLRMASVSPMVTLMKEVSELGQWVSLPPNMLT